MSAFSFIPTGSGSGADLSQITAGEAQILDGYQSVNMYGEPVYGGIMTQNEDPLMTDAVDYPDYDMVGVYVPYDGYYLGDPHGGSTLRVEYCDLASAIGLTEDMLKPGVTLLGVTGV